MIILRRKINEGYYPKSEKNNKKDHMDNVFMVPSDEFDFESGKFESDAVPEKQSYYDLMSLYMDFCSNYIDAYDTEDYHWTFIYENGNIINQDGDNGKYYDSYLRKYVKRIEKNLDAEDRFKAVPRRGLVAIIYSDGWGDYYWYKNDYGKELLVDYTGWSFEQPGDAWL